MLHLCLPTATRQPLLQTPNLAALCPLLASGICSSGWWRKREIGVHQSSSQEDLSGRIDVLMEIKGGKKRSSSSNSMLYEAPLGYGIEDVRPNGGIKKFQSAAYSNCVRKPS